MTDSQNSTNIVIVLDAFRSSLVNKLSVKISLSGDCKGKVGKLVGEIIPPFSFEPDAAFLTGHHPEQTDSGTHFWYAPEASPFYGIKRWVKVVDRLPHMAQLAVRQWIRWHMKRREETKRVYRNAQTARIPFPFLPYFDIAIKHDPLEEGFSQFPTIFDIMEKAGKKLVYIGTPISSARTGEVMAQLRDAPLEGVDLIFLFVGDLDGIGHQYGPGSQEYCEGLRQMGRFVQEVSTFVEKRVGLSRVLIFGDHGMVQVNEIVDVQSALESLPVVPTEDYIYFLDSTLARFWFFNERAREKITALMKNLDGGRLITAEDRESYHIRYPYNRFGELIWWVDGGTLIFPNFWQDRKPVKGMHGYRREVTENLAGFLLMDPGLDGQWTLEQPLEMVDVFATMVDLLGFEMPEGAHGTSVYRRVR